MLGLFMQSGCVLFKKAPALDLIAEALKGHDLLVRSDAPWNDWIAGGPSLTFSVPGIEGAKLVVDICDRPWPDEMGDAKKNPTLLGAWTMGAFGPAVYPGALRRATKVARQLDNDVLQDASKNHRAFVRLRVTYVAGLESPVAPPNREPLKEMAALSEAAVALRSVPGALVWFNPNGDVMVPLDFLDQVVRPFRGGGPPPLAAWVGVRPGTIAVGGEEWLMVDSVGMGTLGGTDVELVLPDPEHDADLNVLVKVAFSLCRESIDQPRPEEGDVVEGRTTSWRVVAGQQALAVPPRDVVRWVPEALTALPPEWKQRKA
jgi:hypothetical protein